MKAPIYGTGGLVDTHCHIHTASSKRDDFTVKKWHEAGEVSAENLLASALAGNVSKLICVGTDYEDSVEAVDFVQNHDNCWASIGVHPHEAKQFLEKYKNTENFEKIINQPRVIALGEIGLDYYYNHSPRKEQINLLEMFLDLSHKYNLPVIFHIREAFDDFWSIVDNFRGVRGVLHSFTSNSLNLDKALSRGFYIGLNGIMTFTKEEEQLAMAKQIPLDRLMLETDAPYLAPKPFRGKVCKPEYIKSTAEFLSSLRTEDYVDLAHKTSTNAAKLFKI